MLKWFKGVTNQKEAKSLYHKLCRQYHPDLGGSVETMQQINAEFESIYDKLPTGSREDSNSKGGSSEERQPNSNNTTRQTAQRFMKIIQRLVKVEGLKIEIVGAWIWLSGDTFKCLKLIKDIGFKYSAKHKKYYLADGDSNRRGSKYTFRQICDIYGCENV
ncbi:hypothetical protein [Ruminococcus sp.]|uniref:hypothetical protein n=1 Tax=Ruminococcus sp. TaxID=41978 RepID=UPI0025ECAA44|nr:hypothetical protein [Ruminococcus sp.]